MQIHKELDTRGLNCPLPILRTKKALGAIQSGQVLRIVATDPMPVPSRSDRSVVRSVRSVTASCPVAPS